MMRRHLRWLAVVFALAVLVYSNFIRNDFNFDDLTIIENNDRNGEAYVVAGNVGAQRGDLR